ncbi:MAG: cation:proton antiporter [Nanoarchaeota archaeon]
MDTLTITLLILLTAAIIAPLLAKKARLPIIVMEIIAGILLGKSFFNIIPDHPIIEFFSSFGLIYIMFLAGLDLNFEEIKKNFSKTAWIAGFSMLVPFIFGVWLSSYIGLNPWLTGTILSTTSLGLIVPLSRELKHTGEFSHVLLGSVVLVDIISMFVLAFVLTSIGASVTASYFYSFMLVLLLFLIPWILRKKDIKEKIERWVADKEHFEIEVRIAFAVIAILTAISGQLGFHSIIGAFIAGLIISEITPKSSLLEKKLAGFGYGFFIPIFFIFMGAKINLPVILSSTGSIKILSAIILVGIFAKIIGVSIVSKIAGFKWKKSIAMGCFHASRLSLIIAAVEIGRQMGIINEILFSSFMMLAIISAIIGPTLGKIFLHKNPGQFL